MAKILTWVTGKPYQWEREDFHKVSDRLLWMMIILATCLYGSTVAMAKVGVDTSTVVAVTMAMFAVIGAGYASSIAIQWADKKLKGS